MGRGARRRIMAQANQTIREVLEKAYSAVLSFPEGLTVLRHILELTGYTTDDIKRYDPKTSELNIHASLYNLAQRDLWIEIKKYITPKQQCVLEEEPFITIQPQETFNEDGYND